MNATPENLFGTRRPPLYDLIADVCETFPGNVLGESLVPEEYRRLDNLRMAATTAFEDLVDQMRSMSMVLGTAIEAELITDSQKVAGCVFLLQTISDTAAALREVETCVR